MDSKAAIALALSNVTVAEPPAALLKAVRAVSSAEIAAPAIATPDAPRPDATNVIPIPAFANDKKLDIAFAADVETVAEDACEGIVEKEEPVQEEKDETVEEPVAEEPTEEEPVEEEAPIFDIQNDILAKDGLFCGDGNAAILDGQQKG